MAEARTPRFPRRAAAVAVAGAIVGLTGCSERGAGPAAATASRTERTPRTTEPQVVPRDGPSGRPVDKVAVITPDPLKATKDVPDAYDRGCQVTSSSQPVSCAYGDPSGETTVALVGDSKVVQWLPALDRVGKARGWRMRTWTKSACAFADAETTLGGGPYESCTAWNANVVATLAANPPDLILTSQGRGDALDESAGGRLTQAAMVAGLQRRWRALVRQGSQVAVLLDNPHPVAKRVYECVAKNRSHLTRCAFDGKPSPAATAQLKAARGIPGVSVIDLNDAICPAATCAAVIGDVLVYRQGSHLTATFVESLTQVLAQALRSIELR